MRRSRPGIYVATVVATLTALGLVAPLVVLLPVSVSSGSLVELPIPGFSLRWFKLVLTSPTWQSSFLFSLAVCLGAACLGLVYSILLVSAINKKQNVARAAFYAVVSLFVIPAPALAISFYVLFKSLIELPSWLALLLSYTILAGPILLAGVRAASDRVDNRLIEAAATLGAPPMQQILLRFRCARALVLSTFVLGVLFVLDDVLVAAFIADPGFRPLSLLLWDGIRQSISPAIAAASVVLVVVAAFLGYQVIAPNLTRELT